MIQLQDTDAGAEIIQRWFDVPIWASVLLTLLLGSVIGLVNGILVTKMHINAFIATLGTGGVLLGLGRVYSDGGQAITQVWNGTLTTSGATASVANTTHNSSLQPSTSTSFGFIATGRNELFFHSTNVEGT